MLMPLVSACGGAEGAPLDRETSTSEPLTNPYDPGAEFTRAGVLLPSNPAKDIVHISAPAVCGDPSIGETFLVVSVDMQQTYRTLFSDTEILASTWGSYGTRQFSSKPVCAMRENGAGGGRGFVLVGKGTDNKLYASAGSWEAHLNDGTATNPSPDTVWTAVSSTAYNQGGWPALASNDSHTGMVLAIVDDSNQVNLRFHKLPYTQNSWGSAIPAPALPAGTTALGAPAVVYLPSPAQLYQVVVRVSTSGGVKLLKTYFDGAKFTTFSHRTPASWSEISLFLNAGQYPSSDVALAYSPTLHTTTLYWRDGNSQFEQTSGFGDELGHNQAHVVAAEAGFMMSSPPSATVVIWEGGNNHVIGRTNNQQLWLFQSAADELLVP